METVDIKVCNLVIKLQEVYDKYRPGSERMTNIIKTLNDASAGELLFTDIQMNRNFNKSTLYINATSTTGKKLVVNYAGDEFNITYNEYCGDNIS